MSEKTRPVRWASLRPKREHALAKFREKIPELSNASASVRMAQLPLEPGEKERQWMLETGVGDRRRKFKGSKESLNRGGGLGGESGYALFQVDPASGALSVLPLNAWYDFRQHSDHKTLSAEEAEEAMKKRDGGKRLQKLRAGGEEDDGGEEGDGGDDFDDGADPNFRENFDEDGREGLDMENEDEMFDDDDNDQFEEDDEQAVGEREKTKQWGATPSGLAGVEANIEDDEDDEGARRASDGPGAAPRPRSPLCTGRRGARRDERPCACVPRQARRASR